RTPILIPETEGQIIRPEDPAELPTPSATEGETATETEELETETEVEEESVPREVRQVKKQHRPQISSASSISLPSGIEVVTVPKKKVISQHDLLNKYFRRDTVVLKNLDLFRYGGCHPVTA
ncbi:hypothetical protein MPER_14189, partial [Moniliophthora perniciosa FA553]